MKQLLFGIGICLAVTGAASAQNSSYDFAMNLGMILASEGACDMTFRQDAVDAYIADNVAADDMEFPTNLSAGMTMGQYRIEEFTKTARAAHCGQVRRIALSHGFIEEGDFQIGVPAKP
ncbi:MAG: hypothetical protein ACOH2N_11300 [Devosia sp.]